MMNRYTSLIIQDYLSGRNSALSLAIFLRVELYNFSY